MLQQAFFNCLIGNAFTNRIYVDSLLIPKSENFKESNHDPFTLEIDTHMLTEVDQPAWVSTILKIISYLGLQEKNCLHTPFTRNKYQRFVQSQNLGDLFTNPLIQGAKLPLMQNLDTINKGTYYKRPVHHCYHGNLVLYYILRFR